MILKGISTGGDSSWKWKSYRKQVFFSWFLNPLFEPNIFTLEDEKGVTFSYKNTLAITIVLSSHNVQRVLMNYGSTINILFKDVMKAKGMPIKGALDLFYYH